ncbi:hypothetical protein EDD15DRAFT_578963 [Pisolithus albus]|nr:hypothetical protein EDD15DRAFT_578963 [Pisolithus albus]
MILGVTNFFSSMLISVVLKCTGSPCWSCRNVALRGERLMLIVECNHSNEDMWVMISGGFTKDSLTAVRVCHIILPTLVGYLATDACLFKQ